MPEVIIKFQLPEEQEEYETTMKANNFSLCLWEFDQQFLRANIKHGIQQQTVAAIVSDLNQYLEEGATPVTAADVGRIAEYTLDHVRSKLYEYMNEHNANPYTS